MQQNRNGFTNSFCQEQEATSLIELFDSAKDLVICLITISKLMDDAKSFFILLFKLVIKAALQLEY